MSDPAQKDDFFVGYLGRLPAAARAMVAAAAVGLIAGFGAAAMAISLTQDDPGPGRILWNERLERTGVLFAAPYPHLRTAPTEAAPEGETYLMVRAGKRGVVDIARRLNGQTVDVYGVWTRRGDIDMIQIGRRGGRPVEPSDQPAAELTAVEDLGRWRLAGEICDSKCYLGAMRPGVGLAHKACANLCIDGGAPPVLVTAKPAEGETFFLLADQRGEALPQSWLADNTAVLVQLEGQLERRGALMVFKIDLDKAELL